MNKKKQIIFVLILMTAAGAYWYQGRFHQKNQQTLEEFIVQYGSIQNAVEVTGKVQPQNRFEIKPPMSGRVDQILVREGEHVKAGDILAVMSSSERATLLDSARLQGPQAVKQWEDVYKQF